MWWRRVRRLLLFSVLAAVVVKAIRSLRGPEAPVFSSHPSAWDGRPPESESPVRPEPVSPSGPAHEAAPEPKPRSEPVAEQPEPATGQTWVEPVDGACPVGFPVKAKARSGIYHEPGMLAYERTRADRCYASSEDARSDGFRAAKR